MRRSRSPSNTNPSPATASPSLFGSGYADTYDVVYASKDYEGECDRLESVFRDRRGGVRSVLDMGCGTGNHAIPLARRGYRVCGVDRAPAMLERARAKAAAVAGAELEFVLGDLRSVQLHRTFDACILMFAVLSYQATNQDVTAALANVARHLEPRGLVVFDAWNATAVEAQGPSERTRVISLGDRRLTRRSSGTLDVREQRCHVHIQQTLVSGDQILAEVEEMHSMRYFFPRELEMLLESAGFEPLTMTPFERSQQALDQNSWNMFVVARRR